MSADAVLSRELRLLQDELAAAQRERSAAPAPAPAEPPPRAPEPAKGTPDEKELHDQLAVLAEEVINFFQQAEKNIAAHPTQSVLGALLVGILIGRLLGRR